MNIDIAESLKKMTLKELAQKIKQSEEPADYSGYFSVTSGDKKTFQAKINQLPKEKNNKSLKNDIPFSNSFDLNNLDESTKKVFSIAFSEGGEDMPFDAKEMTEAELELLGGEVITEFDIKLYEDGTLDHSELDEGKKEKIKNIMEMLKEVEKSGVKEKDDFPDES